MTVLRQNANTLAGRELRLYRVTVAIFAVMVGACAQLNPQKPVKPSAAASSAKGYLYGRFDLQDTVLVRIYIRLENVDTKHTFEIPFEDAMAPPDAIEVAPGTYRIREFVLAGALDVKKIPIPSELELISRPVRVESGEGYYLGDFLASWVTRMKYVGIVLIKYQEWTLQYHQNLEVTGHALKDRYPNLATVELRAAFPSMDSLVTARFLGF